MLILFQVGALIVTPTRELAVQIVEVIASFLEDLPQFEQLLLIGGVNPVADLKKLQEKGYVRCYLAVL